MADQVGMLLIDDANGRRELPTYTCAHCSRVVVLNPGRKRPRAHCLRCQRWICETTKQCSTICTPLHELAADRFEASSIWLPSNYLDGEV